MEGMGKVIPEGSVMTSLTTCVPGSKVGSGGISGVSRITMFPVVRCSLTWDKIRPSTSQCPSRRPEFSKVIFAKAFSF